MIKIKNMRELERICESRNWSLSATIDEAEDKMSLWGVENHDFTVDGIEFACVQPAEYEYDEDDEIVQEVKHAVYSVRDLW